ncbi:GNAT family N-acetyltransferase [Clostridium sp. D2Q-14]|uniref:GNAT family N-acetyltransferase n=1 Tax=Anaeromonas gelatinilytica TaxID=2683194 RepID=UPI00193B1B88|nr:GNAT family protein [Anaeromonas gelatinilytica]MBS4535688.1 GNAT family N-acetyltransferase [Anaeromonas gelatinilytica]
MLKGTKVVLREIKEEDIPLLHKYNNNWSIMKKMYFDVPFPKLIYEDFDRYKKISSNTPDKYSFVIETIHESQLIGECRIIDINWLSRIARIGICIGNKSFHGKGYGTDTLNLLCTFIFDNMNMNKISLKVLSSNSNAINCYLKYGFIEEGYLKNEVFRDGEYLDIIIMSIFK